MEIDSEGLLTWTPDSAMEDITVWITVFDAPCDEDCAPNQNGLQIFTLDAIECSVDACGECDGINDACVPKFIGINNAVNDMLPLKVSDLTLQFSIPVTITEESPIAINTDVYGEVFDFTITHNEGSDEIGIQFEDNF